MTEAWIAAAILLFFDMLGSWWALLMLRLPPASTPWKEVQRSVAEGVRAIKFREMKNLQLQYEAAPAALIAPLSMLHVVKLSPIDVLSVCYSLVHASWELGWTSVVGVAAFPFDNHALAAVRPIKSLLQRIQATTSLVAEFIGFAVLAYIYHPLVPALFYFCSVVANAACATSFNVGYLTKKRISMRSSEASDVVSIQMQWARYPKLWAFVVFLFSPSTWMLGLHSYGLSLSRAGLRQNLITGFVAPEVLFRIARLISWVCLCFVSVEGPGLQEPLGWPRFETEFLKPAWALQHDILTCRLDRQAPTCTFSNEEETSRAVYRAVLLCAGAFFVGLDLLISSASFVMSPVYRGAGSSVELYNEIKTMEREIQEWPMSLERHSAGLAAEDSDAPESLARIESEKTIEVHF